MKIGNNTSKEKTSKRKIFSNKRPFHPNGDQLVKIQVETPTKLSRGTKKTIESLEKDLGPIQNPFSKIDI